MKNKKTLKQKIALGLCCADIAIVLSSLGLGIAGSVVQENARKNFIKSDEYKQAISAQLDEINAKYADKDNTLENLQAQFNDSEYVFSLENQEKLLDASESEYGKLYDIGNTLGNTGLGIAVAGIPTAVATAISIIDANIEKRELSSQKKKPLQDTLGDWTIEK